MVVIFLYLSLTIADKLSPAHWFVFALISPPIEVGGISKKGCTIGVKCLNLMVIVSDNYFLLVIIINRTNTNIQAIGAEATVAIAVCVRPTLQVTAFPRPGVITGPPFSNGSVRFENEYMGIGTFVT